MSHATFTHTVWLALIIALAALVACAGSTRAPSPASPRIEAGPAKDLECAINSFALEFASTIVPPDQLGYVHDALNIDLLCNGSGSGKGSTHAPSPPYTPSHASAREKAVVEEALLNRHSHSHTAHSHSDSQFVYFVATNGDDQNPGTQTLPFATLHAAQRAAQSHGCADAAASCSVIVYLRGGTYYMGDMGGTVQLTPKDSNTRYTGYGTEMPVLSGGTRLRNLDWTPYPSVPGAYVADLSGLYASGNFRDVRVEEWEATHSDTRTRAGPSPLVGDLFVDGVRQVRARYPNGNIQVWWHWSRGV